MMISGARNMINRALCREENEESVDIAFQGAKVGPETLLPQPGVPRSSDHQKAPPVLQCLAVRPDAAHLATGQLINSTQKHCK